MAQKKQLSVFQDHWKLNFNPDEWALSYISLWQMMWTRFLPRSMSESRMTLETEQRAEKAEESGFCPVSKALQSAVRMAAVNV